MQQPGHNEHLESGANRNEVYTAFESQRPPFLNLITPGHGNLNRDGLFAGESSTAITIPVQTTTNGLFAAHTRLSASLGSMSSDRPESVYGQEGIEKMTVEVGDMGRVPWSVVLRAPSPDEGCHCHCRCRGCLCRSTHCSRLHHASAIDNDQDSPPESLMVELDTVPVSLYSSQRSLSTPNMSGMLHGVVGGVEGIRRGDSHPLSRVQNRTMYASDEEMASGYPLQLSDGDV